MLVRPAPLLLAALLVGAFVPAADATDTSSSRLIVGYDPAYKSESLMLIRTAGGEVVKTSDDLHFAVVVTKDEGTFRRAVSTSPFIRYVEADDVTRLAGAQWNGAQWNGAQWNGAQWNGAQWNGAQWNGAQWNDANLKDVSEDQRLAAKWTEKHYQADSTNKMRWAGDSTDPGLVWQWGSWATRTNHAWTAGWTGTRTASLCVLDSGVAWDHPDIAPNYAAGVNVIDREASAYDDGGHGTHVAGIAAGAIPNAYGVAGVGNARILNAKILDANGAGHESDLAIGLAWCANQGADVAVMALSATQPGPSMDAALDYAAKRDVLMLASAGNAGPCTDCVAYPANDPRVLAVAAVDGNLKPAVFSSQGPQVDFAAPGVAMLGPFPGDAFVFGSGTSQAVAFAAGAAALVRDAHPHLTAAQAGQRLAASAKDLGAAGADPATGTGLVQTDKAMG